MNGVLYAVYNIYIYTHTHIYNICTKTFAAPSVKRFLRELCSEFCVLQLFRLLSCLPFTILAPLVGVFVGFHRLFNSVLYFGANIIAANRKLNDFVVPLQRLAQSAPARCSDPTFGHSKHLEVFVDSQRFSNSFSTSFPDLIAINPKAFKMRVGLQGLRKGNCAICTDLCVQKEPGVLREQGVCAGWGGAARKKRQCIT